MLILTRNLSQSIIIGDDISISVIGVQGNQIRLGITAPKDISIYREELYRKIHDELKYDDKR